MKDKLYKKDYIELHHRILKELIRDEDGKDILSFSTFSANCCLIFNSNDKPEKMIYDESLYYLPFKEEIEIKNRLAALNESSNGYTSVEDDRIERHDAASYGAGLAMGAVGITSTNQIH